MKLTEDLSIGNHDNIISYVKLGFKAMDILRGKYGSVLLRLRGKGGDTLPTQGTQYAPQPETSKRSSALDEHLMRKCLERT